MASYYEHHYEVFGAECLRAGFMIAAMEERAQSIRAAAVGLSPRRSGAYSSSFQVSTGIGSYGGEGTRAYGRVSNPLKYAGSIEYGFGNVPKYRVLGKAAGMIGGKYRAGGGNP